MTWEQLYHVVMVTYPGYTVRRIEEELSMRELRALQRHADTHPPAHRLLDRMERMMERYTGIRFEVVRPQGDAELVQTIRDMGWLDG